MLFLFLLSAGWCTTFAAGNYAKTLERTNGNTIRLEVRPTVDDGDEDHWQVRFWVDLEFLADGSSTWTTVAEGDIDWRLLEGSKWTQETTLNDRGSGTYRITGNADFFNFCTNVYEWDVGQGEVRTVTVSRPAVTVTGQ